MRTQLEKDDAQPPRGLTLLELLVALVLSVLVLAMAMPMLTTVMHPSARLDVKSESLWSNAIAADLREIVSPGKSAYWPVRVIPVSDSDPTPVLVIETFARVGDQAGQIPLPGPNEVQYRLEPVQDDGPYQLVRVAQGWHDALTTRFVVAQHVTRWSVEPGWSSANSPKTQPQAKAGDGPMPEWLSIEVSKKGDTPTFQFDIPEVRRPVSAASEPDATRKNSP